MSPLKPYLVRALYDWIVDNDHTPYLLADTRVEGVVVPGAYIQDDRIVLNLRPAAVQGLLMNNERISFRARFGGKPTGIEIPIRAVLALYSQENGRGMVFDQEEDGDDTEPPAPADSAPAPERKRPHLRVVK